MQYAGFDPGTYQPWALNIVQDVLGQPGVARGMQVIETGTPSMAVQVTVDPFYGDGVAFLPNGGWVRQDASSTLTVPANVSGVSRQDAVVAYVDPTGTTAGGLYYLSGFSGSFTPSGNQLVLALVTVPNGASSIISSNIMQTPLQASVGTAAANEPDTVIGDETSDIAQQGIFVANGIVLTSSALSGQTSFAIPLTSMQRLVPIGRIGGAVETGLFASEKGWYKPLVYGSVSGILPVLSLDCINNAVVTATGAQAGEQVSISFKYYDFARDLMVWGGEMLLERDSPYIVYQSACHPGTLYGDYWYGSRGSVQLQPGDVVQITSPSIARRPHLAAVGSISHYSVVGNGVAFWGPRGIDPGVMGIPFSAGWLDYIQGGNDPTPYFYTLTINDGLMEFAGLSLYFNPQSNALVDGGEVLVDGYRVYVQSASVTMPTWASSQGGIGTLYVTRYGGVTASSVLTALAEQSGGVIPVARAVGYGSVTGVSSLWGVYALPHQPSGYQPHLLLLNTPYDAPNGWNLVHNLTSAYGMIAVSSYSQDTLMTRAWCSGADIVATATQTVPLNVNVANVTSYNTYLAPGGFVPLTLCTSLPASYYNIQVTVLTSAGSFGVESVELRQPAFPQSPPGTFPLAHYWLSSGSGTLHRSFAQSVDITNKTSSLFRPIIATSWNAPSFAVSIASTFSDQQIALFTYAYSSASLAYVAGPGSGQMIVGLGNNTQTVDCWAATPTIMHTSFSGVNGASTFNVWPLGTMNISSTGTAIQLISLETLQPPYTLLDARRHATDGVKPSVRGSALFSHKGEPLLDASYGIQTQHLADRSVTSRKVRLNNVGAIATTAYSGFPAVDPYLSAEITVDVPSLLLIEVNAHLHINASAGGLHRIFVDGIATSGTAGGQSGVFSPSNNNVVQAVAPRDQVVVGPGTHTITWTHDHTITSWATAPGWLDSNPRIMTVTAFAI